MKKLITILMAASILFAHGCGAKTETETTINAETTTTAAVQQTETTEAEETTKLVTEFSHSFKKAYYELFTNEFEYLEHTITDSEYRYYTGILFADLFDWNLDGVPELMIGYSLDEQISYQAQYLDIYTMNNDKAERIVHANIYSSYGALDGSQTVKFTQGKDGTLYLGIANEETEEMSFLGETYYTFKDGEIESTRFWAELNYDNYEFCDYKIDGKKVTEDQFNDKRNEMGCEDVFCAHADYCEYDMLLDYLTGETETYTNQFFSVHNYPEDIPSWVSGVDFGYNTKFAK